MTAAEPTYDPDLVRAVLDRLIPAERGFPAAGIAAFAHVEKILTAANRTGESLRQSFATIVTTCHTAFSKPFLMLDTDQQDAVLRHVETITPASFDTLLVHTYSGYYTHPEVSLRLGLAPGAPQPRGQVFPPTELELLTELLQPVRDRPPLYRDG